VVGHDDDGEIDALGIDVHVAGFDDRGAHVLEPPSVKRFLMSSLAKLAYGTLLTASTLPWADHAG
jgi:hypothetical protein